MLPTILRFSPGLALPPSLYLDANFLVDTHDRRSRRYSQASYCFGELLRRGAALHVSALVIDELWWATFRVLYRNANGSELRPQEYKSNASVWRTYWPQVRAISERIMRSSTINHLPYTSPAQLVTEATQLMDINALAPRDAFHLAVVLHHSIPAMVTGDTDFDSVALPSNAALSLVKY